MPLLPASLRTDAPSAPRSADSHRADGAGASDESLKMLVAGCHHHSVKQWAASAEGGAASGHAAAPPHGPMGAGTLHCVTRRFEESEVVELFIGQLPYGVEPIGLLDVFQQLLQAKTTHKKPIAYRLKTGWQPTCAFVAVGAQYADALLAFSKRVLCDRSGFWVAPVGDEAALMALTKASEDRHRCPVEGLPSVPMVIERIKEGKLGTRCHRSTMRRTSGGPTQPPPPSYSMFPYSGPVQPYVGVMERTFLQGCVPCGSGTYGSDQVLACTPSEALPRSCAQTNANVIAALPKMVSPIYFWCAAPSVMETTVGGR